MRVLIAGASGQLGRELTLAFGEEHQVLAVTSQQLDITRQELCLDVVRTFRPDLVVNAAAYTKVDDCETREKLAYAVNAVGARNVALAASEVGARCVYISTDYVFNGAGTEPYMEFDPPDPINVYGRTKLAGEELTRSMTHRHYVVRTSWLCGQFGPNFVKTMIRLAGEKSQLEVVNDQFGCPTFAADLAQAILTLTQTERYGTYHITNDGACTWFDFATEILRQAGSRTRVLPTTSDRYVRPARRPSYSVLGQTAWRAEGFAALRPWQDALSSLLPQLGL